MCYHLERMGDDGSFGWRAGTGWVPLGSLLESICGWASIALADITLKGRCLVKWPVQCHMNRCPANVCSHHHHGMCGSRSTNRVFSVGLWQAHQTALPFRIGSRNGERQASGSFQRAGCAGEQVGRAGALKVLWLLQPRSPPSGGGRRSEEAGWGEQAKEAVLAGLAELWVQYWLLRRFCLPMSTLGCHVWRGRENKIRGFAASASFRIASVMLDLSATFFWVVI